MLGEFGLRPGELFHLTWGSFDWSLGNGENRGALRVEEQKRTRIHGGKTWVPKNGKFCYIPFTLRGREILEQLRSKASDATANELVIPNENGLPYLRLDVGPMKGGGASVWKKLREVSGVEDVAMPGPAALFRGPESDSWRAHCGGISMDGSFLHRANGKAVRPLGSRTEGTMAICHAAVEGDRSCGNSTAPSSPGAMTAPKLKKLRWPASVLCVCLHGAGAAALTAHRAGSAEWMVTGDGLRWPALRP